MAKIIRKFLLFILVILNWCWLFMQEASPLSNTESNNQASVYQIIKTYKHDPEARTEGLFYNNGVLYESVGGYRKSSLSRIELETNNLKKHQLAECYYGEGITLLNNTIVQLTWQERVAFIYDSKTLEPLNCLNSFRYSSEGWGITYDEERLIISDGSDTLHLIDPESFIEFGNIHVRDSKDPVNELNELEYVEGEIFANVPNNRIARISPTTGRVLGWIDLSGLYEKEKLASKLGYSLESDNSIAYDPQTKHFFVTGKNWPDLFEIKLNYS